MIAHSDRLRVGLFVYGLDRPASGIGRYAVELVNALRATQPGIDTVLLKPFAGPVPGILADGPAVELPLCRRLVGTMAFAPVALARAAAAHGLDVVHDPTGASPFFVPRRLARFARVVTLHDMVPFVYPETHAPLTNALFRHYIPRSLPAVDRIVTVSAASKRDIEQFYRWPGDRVEVIANGVAPHFRPRTQEEVAAVLARYGVDGPFVLSVGALQARKNLGVLFEAFARLRAAGLPHRLVLVGAKVWKADGVFRRLGELDLESSVVVTGYVDDDDLPALFSGAACFVYPSIYEGFGLPPLEAMACGVPVVTSNASSLPEVVGDAGLMVAPGDVGGFAEAIARVLADPALAERLREQGLRRAAGFTWEEAARQHADLYRRLAADRARGRRR